VARQNLAQLIQHVAQHGPVTGHSEPQRLAKQNFVAQPEILKNGGSHGAIWNRHQGCASSVRSLVERNPMSSTMRADRQCGMRRPLTLRDRKKSRCRPSCFKSFLRAQTIGGISILTDRAVLVGDACRIGDQRGIVEDIGLRSTKLRTEERTLVSIPNGTVATAVLENFRCATKILFRQTLRLRYDLSPDHVRYVLDQLRQILTRHAKIDEPSARVRLLKLERMPSKWRFTDTFSPVNTANFLSCRKS